MDIIELPIDFEKLPMDSRYRLVIIASQRAKQLMEGAKKLTGSSYTKETTVSLEEIVENKVQFLVGKEARLAYREMKKIKDADPRDGMFPEEGGSGEIKKDVNVGADNSGSNSSEGNGESSNKTP